MNVTAGLHFFSYKSAFLFFSFIIVFNLIFNPIMNSLEIDKHLSLFIGNSFAISAGLTMITNFVEGKCKTKKKSAILFLSLLAVSTMVCYVIVYQ